MLLFDQGFKTINDGFFDFSFNSVNHFKETHHDGKSKFVHDLIAWRFAKGDDMWVDKNRLEENEAGGDSIRPVFDAQINIT